LGKKLNEERLSRNQRLVALPWRVAHATISRYHYPSARFYETGMDDFGFLNNLYTVFNAD